MGEEGSEAMLRATTNAKVTYHEQHNSVVIPEKRGEKILQKLRF